MLHTIAIGNLKRLGILRLEIARCGLLWYDDVRLRAIREAKMSDRIVLKSYAIQNVESGRYLKRRIRNRVGQPRNRFTTTARPESAMSHAGIEYASRVMGLLAGQWQLVKV